MGVVADLHMESMIDLGTLGTRLQFLSARLVSVGMFNSTRSNTHLNFYVTEDLPVRISDGGEWHDQLRSRARRQTHGAGRLQRHGAQPQTRHLHLH